MNSNKIKLKQEKKNIKVAVERLSFSEQIRDKMVDNLVGKLAQVDEDTRRMDKEDIKANALLDIVESCVKLAKYDEKITTERLVEAFKEVTVDTSRMVKMGIREVDPVRLQEILEHKIDHKTYSDRIWINKMKLADEVYTIVDRQIKHGTDLKKAARDISERYEVDYNSAMRLLHNETARVEYAAKDDVYMNSPLVEEVERITMEDDRVSDICAAEHGDIWRKDDPNKPELPRHIGCRCMYRPHYKKMDKYKFN